MDLMGMVVMKSQFVWEPQLSILTISIIFYFSLSFFSKSLSVFGASFWLKEPMQEKKEKDGFMSYFSCCGSIRAREEKAKIDDDRKTTEYNRGLTKTVTFMTNISVKSDNSRQRVIAREVAKIGKPKDSTKVFTYQELVSATDNFNSDCMVGEGGFGKVYKGFIKSSNRIVAIKKLDREGRQGSREFLAEVTMLSVVENENLVNLVGYCMQGDQRILVYDFMPNGSLENHLLDLSRDSVPLDWNSRMRIAAGAAKGLEYLHEVANPPIIFRDFKASNVLLDEHMNPRLSDFGLAKVGPSGESEHVSKRVMGTFGYCAPEYARSGKLTTKSDVYSYGVVLMELISGRRVIDTARPREEQNMIVWAQPLLKEKKNFPFIADPLLEGNYPAKSLHKAFAIAAMCLQEDHESRPSIGEVVCAFEYVIS